MQLPLSETSGGPSRQGVSRLRGAFSIEIGRIRPDPDQPRREFDEQELQNLIASVTEHGIKQPVRVWHVESDDVYQIISGERRYRAAVAAKLIAVPCLIEDAPAGSAPPRKGILVDQIVENWQRADLKPYDLSDALKELRDVHEMSQDDIARLIGKPKSEISRFLAMQRVTADVQQDIRRDESGTFSRRHVVALSKLAPDDQPEVAAKIKTQKLTATETEREVARRVESSEGRAPRGAPMTIRRFTVGSAQVKITFRKRQVSASEVIDVIDRVKAMVVSENDSEQKASA